MANINEVVNAIAIKLDSLYPNIQIYTENIEQGFKEPCFFIKVLKVNLSHEVGRLYKKDISIDVHYFTDKEVVDCYEVADNLFFNFRNVIVGTKSFKAISVDSDVSDGVLHFYMKFPHRLIESKPIEPSMKTLEVSVYGKK